MSRTIVITGASDGIGAAAAGIFHKKGHRVIVVGRSPEKTRAVAGKLGVEHHICDFAELSNVRQLAEELNRSCPRIDVLANNAGGIFGDRAKTIDGFEKTFQVNHLAPFLLTKLLIDKLIDSHASVIQTSSIGARLLGRMDMEDLEHDKDFSASLAYGTAKLANILFTRELHRCYHSKGISTAAFHPGAVATSFATASSSIMKPLYNSRLARAFMTSPEKGAGQLVWFVEGKPGADWESGLYYEAYRPAKRNNPQALDDELATQFWERSEAMLGPSAPLSSASSA